MRWVLAVRCRAVLLALLVCPAVSHPTVQRHFSVDDYLKLEDTGQATVDPTGRWLVYVRIPPYDELPDYSVGRIGTWNGSGGLLRVVDLTASTPVSTLLFTPDPDTVYWIDGFSPDGQYLAYYAARAGQITAGVYDLAKKVIHQFEPAPRVDWINGHTSTWISRHALVYAAVAPGHQPSSLSLRRYTGERYMEEWRKAWAGREPAVSVVTSKVDGGGDTFLDGRLILADVSTDQIEVLAQGQFDDLQLSADGRYLAALRQGSLPQPDPKRLLQDWVQARSVLMLFDLTGGSAPRTIAPEKDVYPRSLAWSSEADRIAFFAWDRGAGVQSGIFHAVAARDGKMVEYPHTGLDLASERERGYEQCPERVVWLGNQLAVFARATGDSHSAPRLTYRDIRSPSAPAQTGSDKADWYLVDTHGRHQNLTASLKKISAIPVHATSRHLFVLSDGHVWKVGPHQQALDLTPGIEGELAHPYSVLYTEKRPPFTGFATFESRRSAQWTLTLVDLRAQRVKVAQVASPAAQARLMAGSPTAGAVVFREDTRNGASIVLNRSGGSRFVIDTLNPYLSDISAARWIKVGYPAGPGRELQSCVLLPPDYQPGKRYPTIVEVYPGRGASCLDSYHSQMGGAQGSYSMHLLAAQGYVVLEAAAPQDLLATQDGPLAGMPDLVLRAVDAVIQRGYADPHRLGLLGLSQGGISALWIAAHTDRFQAVVALNSWTDLWSHYFEGAETVYSRFYPEEFPYIGEASRYESTAGTYFGIGHSAWDDPEAYIRNSPIYQVDRINTPVMLVHSDMDAFPLEQFDEMFSALYRKRKEAVFVRYWGEGHSPSSPANIRDLWHRIFDWYAAFGLRP